MRLPAALILLALIQQPHQADIDPDDLPDDAVSSPEPSASPHHLTETITVSAMAAPRAKDEEALRDLLLQDIRNASVSRSIVDVRLRARIRAMFVKVQAEE